MASKRLIPRLVTVLACWALACPVAADTVVYQDSQGQVINSQLTVGGSSYNVDWFVPTTSATTLMTFQHGFSRGCGNIRNTGINVMHQGVMLLCLNADMQGGNPGLGAALGDALVDRVINPPAPASLPARYIVSGHSAGGHFASAVGRRIVERGYGDFVGAILFDPVAAGGFTENLNAISASGTRAVYAITAIGSPCNSFSNAEGALTGLPNPFVGLYLTTNSSHVDVEDGNTDTLMQITCGFVQSFNVTYLQTLSGAWAKDLSNGTTTADYYPGGSYVSSLISQGRAEFLKSCGNAAADSGEQCDLGMSNGQTGSCCTTTCTYVSTGSVCRASTGLCDIAETCSGGSASCPSDANPACTPSFTPTRTPTLSPSRSPTLSPTLVATPTPTATLTDTPTHSPTPLPSDTATATATETPTATGSVTPTHSPTLTHTNTATRTATATDTASPTPTQSPTATQTLTPTASETASPTPTTTPIPPEDCPSQPLPYCKAASPGAGSLTLSGRTGSPQRSKITWQWNQGAATTMEELGDPTTNTNYRLCLYDGDQTPIANLQAWGGIICNTRSCWTAKPNGFNYRSPGILPSGITSLSIQTGTDGLARIVLKAKGPNVPLPELPLSQASGNVVAQLINNSTNACWQTTYSAPTKSDPSSTTKWVDRND